MGTKKTNTNEAEAQTQQLFQEEQPTEVRQTNFRERVVALQNELKAPKSRYNSFAKYSYRSCEDILEAVKPLTLKYGLLLNICDEVVVVGERYYIKATAVLLDCFSQEAIFSTAFAREDENKKGYDQSQLSGSCSSYCRKYCLNALLLCDDQKDSDTDEYAKQNGKATADKKTYLDIIAEITNLDESRKVWAEIKSNFPDTTAEYSELRDALAIKNRELKQMI